MKAVLLLAEEAAGEGVVAEKKDPP